MIYLFYGFGSEYVLNDLYKLMSKKGYNCIEIDALKIKDSKKIINSLKHKPVTLITSAHFLLDKKNFNEYYPSDNVFYSVLEIISILNPIKKIFIPHDLTEPTIIYEEMFLNQFDFFISPCEPYTTLYSQFCNTVELGWVKYQKDKTIKVKNKAIWFISDFILHINMGVEPSFNLTKPILEQNVSVKFPLWNSSNEFEQYYKNLGVDVFDARTLTTDLINSHDIIITNGLSSLIAESYLRGKIVVNIMENSHYGDKKDHLKSIFPDLIFFEKIADFSFKKIPTSSSRHNVLQPFNVKEAVNLITK